MRVMFFETALPTGSTGVGYDDPEDEMPSLARWGLQGICPATREEREAALARCAPRYAREDVIAGTPGRVFRGAEVSRETLLRWARVYLARVEPWQTRASEEVAALIAWLETGG